MDPYAHDFTHEQTNGPRPSVYAHGMQGHPGCASAAYNRSPSSMRRPSWQSAGDGMPGGLAPTAENTPTNRIVDGLLQSLLDGVKPFLLSMALSALHHYKNRNAEVLTRYNDSKYSRYRDNILFCLEAYQFMRVNGVSNPKRSAPAAERRPQGADQRSRGLGGQAREPMGWAGELDDYWAVPRDEAAHYYSVFYGRRAGLASADARMMGAAAAVWALNSGQDPQRAHLAAGSAAQEAVMERALDEAEALLAHKASVAALGPDDNIDIVGRYALATVIDTLATR
ncbi:hypothetical protein H4R21_003306 [Coemansia helicoidea]|uniref:Uncharacterized protein n=1 Tax=Coemansia helicoidea TaxID=1286919 RepID=A0ACC1L2E6_9FUNG|nr:hypothetical protein H4R21_003306 [Coemansia helicoidea]